MGATAGRSSRRDGVKKLEFDPGDPGDRYQPRTSSAGPYRDTPPLLKDPPRKVPGSVTVRILFGGTQVQLGWAYMAAGLLILFASLGHMDRGGAYSTSAQGIVRSATN